MKPISSRPFHAFFAGQIKASRTGIGRILESPKDLARRDMLNAALSLKKTCPSFAFDYHADVGTGVDFAYNTDRRTYSQRMMDSKICLAPRGTVIDTWRMFEGLKSGCLIVCEPLPDDYFYKNAPVIQIDSWNDLEKVLAPFIGNDADIQKWSDRSIAFWNHVCGEAATGYRIAEFINQSTVLILGNGRQHAQPR